MPSTGPKSSHSQPEPWPYAYQAIAPEHKLPASDKSEIVVFVVVVVVVLRTNAQRPTNQPVDEPPKSVSLSEGSEDAADGRSDIRCRQQARDCRLSSRRNRRIGQRGLDFTKQFT